MGKGVKMSECKCKICPECEERERTEAWAIVEPVCTKLNITQLEFEELLRAMRGYPLYEY